MKAGHIKKLLFVNLILHIVIIVLQAIPYGVVYKMLIVEDGMKDYIIRTYSYFSLYPFIHLNIAPLSSAIASTIAAIFCLINLWDKSGCVRYLKIIVICLLIAIAGSTITFVTNTTIVAGVVTGFLIIILLLYVLPIKYLTLTLIILCLSGCGNLQNEQLEKKMDISEKEAEIGEATADLSKEQEIFLPEDYFNQGFMESGKSRHEEKFKNLCLNSLYNQPQDVNLKELFYDGFGLSIDEADRSFLEKQGAQTYLDIVKLPKSYMDDILMQYFGITLSETNMVGLENFYYNADKDIYYLVHSDTHHQYIDVIEQYLDESGNLNIVYTMKDNVNSSNESGCQRAVLKKDEDRYLFFSNQIVRQVDEETYSPSVSPDDILRDYIKETVPDTAVALEASFMTDYVQIAPKEKIGINDEIDTEVYSFISQEEKTMVYTVISITYPSTVKISPKDTITVTANDYVANFSPAEAILLTKSKQEDEWTKKRDIAAMVTGQQVEIYSGEIYNREPYSRVILSFPALESAEAAEDAPRYHIQYTNYKDSSHIEWIIVIVLLMLVVLLLLIYNKRIHRNDNLE